MSRYIDAEEAKKALLQLQEDDFERFGGVYIPEGFDGERAAATIDAIPTADVEEVVRCKNCKYCEKIDDHEWWCCGRGFPAVLTAPEDYCSKGAKISERINHE